MNKKLKKVLIVIGVIVVIIGGITVGYGLKMKSEIDKLLPMETKKIVDNIYVIQDSFANLFVIKDSSQYIVIDCGQDPTVVAAEMKRLDIDINNVAAVLLTHTDGDHVGALSLFSKAKLYMSREEEKMINGEQPKFLIFGNSIGERTDYKLLDDRQVIHIGNVKIEGILAPGHTSGMMAYLVNDKYLFTGDIFSLKNGKMERFNEFFNMNTDEAVKSMEIVRHIPTAEYIFTAHYGYTDNYKKAVE